MALRAPAHVAFDAERLEILQPFEGRVFDPACGSGGMFVQCAKFVERRHESASRKLSVFGAEKTDDTVPLAKMNLALHGLSGDIRQANSYYEDPHSSIGAFDYVMANPPFNVDKIKKDQLAGDKRFPFGLPRADNGNFLWIQQFWNVTDQTAAGRAESQELDPLRQLRLRRGPFRDANPQTVSRVRYRRRDDRHQLQLFLHSDLAGDAVVLGQGQDWDAA